MLYKPNPNPGQRKDSQHKNSTNSPLGSSSKCEEAPLASPEQEFLGEKRSILSKLARMHHKRN